jgi:hypothetical protein
MSQEAVQIQYKCRLCAITNGRVTVKARTLSDNILEWMDKVVIEAIAKDHRHRSPLCLAKEITEVKIPVQDDVIGKPHTQQKM